MRADEQNPLSDPLHFELLAWVFGHLEANEFDDFRQGVVDRLRRLEVSMEGQGDLEDFERTATDLNRWVRSWVVSVKLGLDPEWQKDVQETSDNLRAGVDMGEVGEKELRRLLGV